MNPLIAQLELMAEKLTVEAPAFELRQNQADDFQLATLIQEWRKRSNPTAFEVIQALHIHAPGCDVYDVIDYLREKEGGTLFHLALVEEYEKKKSVRDFSERGQIVACDIVLTPSFPKEVRTACFDQFLLCNLPLAVELTPVLNPAELETLLSTLEAHIPKNQKFELLKRLVELVEPTMKRDVVAYFKKQTALSWQFECDVRNDPRHPGTDILHDFIKELPKEVQLKLKALYLSEKAPPHCILIYLGIYKQVSITQLSLFLDSLTADVLPKALPGILSLEWHDDTRRLQDKAVLAKYLQETQEKFESLCAGIIADPRACWNEKMAAMPVIKPKSKPYTPLLQVVLRPPIKPKESSNL
ncbi:MAG: hypothetical protein JSS12_01080 [Verrucomicrobia bacterium]|nr:hypothetical protein [Verrucomicrobiota bacterium]